MARRRLLTILAASAVLSASFAGPAAALELVDDGQDSVVEETAETTEETVETTVEVVEDVAGADVEEPVETVEDAPDEVTEVVAPEPETESEPEPAPSQTSSRSGESAAPASPDEPADDLVAAGDVAEAPSLAYLTGTRGSAPTSSPQSPTGLPLAAPAVAPVAPATGEVEAPQIAPAPTEDAGTSDGVASVVAEAAARTAEEHGVPALVLVAIASVLAAGASTLREARAVASA